MGEELIKRKGTTLFLYQPLCSVLSNSLSSSRSTLTNALTYSESAEELECKDG
jgi:hypothetical protein